MERGLLAAIGGGMALFAGLMVAYFVGELTSGSSENTVGLNAGLVVFFIGMLASGVFLIWRMLQPGAASSVRATRPGVGRQRGKPTAAAAPARPANEVERERVVLKLAERQRGRVTIPEVAARCDMTIAEAKEALNLLVLQQVAHMQVTDSGGLVYVFNGFLSDQEKARARDF